MATPSFQPFRLKTLFIFGSSIHPSQAIDKGYGSIGKCIMNTPTSFHVNCSLLLQAGVTATLMIIVLPSAPLPPPTPSPRHTSCHNDPFKVAFLFKISSDSFPLKGNAQIPPVAWKLLYNLSDLPARTPSTFVIHSVPLPAVPMAATPGDLQYVTGQEHPVLGARHLLFPYRVTILPDITGWFIPHRRPVSLFETFPKLAIENCIHPPQSPSRSPLLCLFFCTDACHPWHLTY